MKRIKKILITLIILVLCTGCSIDYKLEITSDSIIEQIDVVDKETTDRTKDKIYKEYQRWFPVYTDISDTPTEFDITEKIDGIEYHEKNITETEEGYNYTYKYNYPITKYQDASVIRQMYSKKNIYIGTDYITINTDKNNLLCNYSYFDSINIDISVDPKVYTVNKTNADDITNNTYSWNFDKSNCNDSKIILILDMIKQEEDAPQEDENTVTKDDESSKEKKDSDYIMYIIVGVLILIILIGKFIFDRLQEKSNNIDIDD